jgi:hypothetical protein
MRGRKMAREKLCWGSSTGRVQKWQRGYASSIEREGEISLHCIGENVAIAGEVMSSRGLAASVVLGGAAVSVPKMPGVVPIVHAFRPHSLRVSKSSPLVPNALPCASFPDLSPCGPLKKVLPS